MLQVFGKHLCGFVRQFLTVERHAHFKIEQKTAVIEVGRAHHAVVVIYHQRFGMQQGTHVFVHLRACIAQFFEVRTRRHRDPERIAALWHKDFDFHPPQGRIEQCIPSRLGGYKIRCRQPHAMLRHANGVQHGVVNSLPAAIRPGCHQLHHMFTRLSCFKNRRFKFVLATGIGPIF